MTVFEELRSGISYDIRDEKYQREAHGEMDRCRHICWQINSTDPADRERIMQLEHELLNGQMTAGNGNFFTPPFQIDCANCAAKVENAVNKLDGVKKCTISFMTQKLTLETDCEDQSAIVREIERVGKKADSDFEIEAK